MFQRVNMITISTQCCIFITEFEFQNCQTNEIRREL